MATIESFTISKLFNRDRNISIKFKDNILILIGENGSGKTSILQCFFYALTKQWTKLLPFNFYSISITIDGREFSLLHEEIEELFIHQTSNMTFLSSPILKK